MKLYRGSDRISRVRTPLKFSFILAALLFFPLNSRAGQPPLLYEKYCSRCHGPEGDGGAAPALRKEGLLRTTGLDYFIKTIRFGRPLRGCPSFDGEIPDNEIREIALYIKGWQKEATLEAPAHDVTPEATPRGEDLFNLCAGCHGLEGEGAMGPPLLDEGLLESISDLELRRTIIWGRPGTPMKGFQKGQVPFASLTDREVDQIISYIRYMQKKMK